MQRHFLCHNSKDKDLVRKVNEALTENDIETWLDEDDIPIGVPWYKWLFNNLRECAGIIVFLGESGIGPYQNQELENVLREFESSNKPVIPVLLPSFSDNVDLPVFIEDQLLNKYNRVDLRDGVSKGIEKLVKGISNIPYQTVREPESIKQIPDIPKINQSWSLFHISWVILHVIGYVIVTSVATGSVFSQHSLAAITVGTLAILLLLIYVGYRQIRLHGIVVDRTGVYWSIFIGLFISTLVVGNSPENRIYEQIGAIATIVGTGVIAGAAGGWVTGIVMSLLAGSGAFMAAFLLPFMDFDPSSNIVPIMFGTMFWALVLSIALRVIMSEHRKIREIQIG